MATVKETINVASTADLVVMLQKAGFSPIEAEEIAQTIKGHFDAYEKINEKCDDGNVVGGIPRLAPDEVPQNLDYYEYTNHARNRMGERDISEKDVWRCVEAGGVQCAKGVNVFRFTRLGVVVVAAIDHENLKQELAHNILTTYKR